MKTYLLPIEVGKNIIRGYEGKVIVSTDSLYIKCLNDPVYRNGRWECLAIVNSSLCIIEVKPYTIISE